MAVTAISFSPEIVAVGQTVSVLPVGSIPTNTDLRYYLLSAPPSSSLETLATYEANGKTLADIRLKVKGNGQGEFTPDVPGMYVAIVRPVTTYDFIPSYGGEIPPYINPSNPDLGRRPAKADNEEGPFTDANGGVTAQVSDVPAFGQTLWVYETLTRSVGFTQDTATLAVKVYNNRVVDHPSVSDAVKITPGQTAPSKTAVYAADVESVLDHARTITSNGHKEFAYHVTVLGGLIAAWNSHLELDDYKVHTTVADVATDALASTANVSASLSSIGTRLDDIVAKYNAHRVRLTDPTTSGGLHQSADTTNVMTAGSVADLASAIAYYEHVLLVLQAHGTNVTDHATSVAPQAGDGYFGWLAEPPRSLTELAQAINGTSTSRWANFGLTSLYENHRVRSTVKIHSSSESLGLDTTNTVKFLRDTPATLYQSANALADAITRHVQNKNADGTNATTPYHYADADRSRLPTRRASDARSFALCVEELWICMESHLWSAGPPTGYDTTTTAGSRGQHPARSWGLGAIRSAPSNSSRPMAMIRLAKAFDAALSETTATEEQTALGYLGAQMRLVGGFT